MSNRQLILPDAPSTRATSWAGSCLPPPPPSSSSTITRPAIRLPHGRISRSRGGLREVGELVGVRVLDHIVIGKGRYVSFVDDGYW